MKKLFTSPARNLIYGLIAGLLITGASVPAQAAEGGAPLKEVDWSFNGPFGTYDRASVQRGFQVYREVCSACHSLKYIAFRNLTDIGFSENQVKAIASDYLVVDGPDEFGDMFEREGRPFDYIPGPFANDNAARAANNGALPPDLSLITKARSHGANYVYSLLNGYEDGHDVAPGMNYNAYFPGNEIAMGQPLFEEQVLYTDGTTATLEQMSHDIVMFLSWAAEPTLEARHEAGYKVILFLLALTTLLYLSYKKVWADVKGKKED
jgi:ubiquinol-cytochrome c reductase cytochrome c1 subunit